MTEAKKPVTRKTACLYRGRVIVATITARTLILKEYGRRDRLEVDFETLLEFAYKMRFRKEEAERRAKKRAELR